MQSDFDGRGIQPIRFEGPGNSANQVLRDWEFTQSDFDRLGIQPIGFRGARKFSQSDFEPLGIQQIRLGHSQKFRLANSSTRIRGVHYNKIVQ